MPLAWTCISYPEIHGSFLQAGLDTLSALFGALQPRDRYGCPRCIAAGEPGWMKPATETEAARIGREHQEA